jgi:hypothetical protein
MSTKRPNETLAGPLVPIAKRAKNEIIAYAARHNKVNILFLKPHK